MHCTEIAHKANTRANLRIKLFLSHDTQLFSRAFIVYVRPLLEYCTPVWCPYNKGDINSIERVQRAFIRKIFYFCHLPPVSYEDRLLHLGLQRLEIRRIHSDLIFLFKIINDLVYCKLHDSLFFSNSVRVGANTRGHKYKLFRTRSLKLVLSDFVINRILPIWNGLPSSCFDIDRLSAFRRKLSYVDFSSFVKGPL